MRWRCIELVTALQHKWEMRFEILFNCELAAGSCAPVSEMRLSAEDRLICMTERDLQGRYVMRMSPFNSACMDYGAPERIRGVWFDEPEGGPFVEGEQNLPRMRPKSRGFVDFTDREAFDVVAPFPCSPIFYVEFVGRRAVREYRREGVRKLGRAMEDDIEVIRGEQILQSKLLGFEKPPFKGGKPVNYCQATG